LLLQRHVAFGLSGISRADIRLTAGREGLFFVLKEYAHRRGSQFSYHNFRLRARASPDFTCPPFNAIPDGGGFQMVILSIEVSRFVGAIL